MFVRANFVDMYLQGMRDRSMRSGTELAREIQLTDWSTAGNLSNRSSGVQIPRDICTRLKRYLYSGKCTELENKTPYFAYMRAKQVIQQKHLFPQLLVSNVLLKGMLSFRSRSTGVQLQ